MLMVCKIYPVMRRDAQSQSISLDSFVDSGDFFLNAEKVKSAINRFMVGPLL